MTVTVSTIPIATAGCLWEDEENEEEVGSISEQESEQDEPNDSIDEDAETVATEDMPVDMNDNQQSLDALDDVPNYDGEFVNYMGESSITITVGADGEHIFDPPAIIVDESTTVDFDWDEQAESNHSLTEVLKREFSESQGDLSQEPGVNYSYNFDEPGLYIVVCSIHEAEFMETAIYVEGTE